MKSSPHPTACFFSSGDGGCFLKNLLATDRFLGQISRLPSAKAVQVEQCRHLEVQVGRAAWTTDELKRTGLDSYCSAYKRPVSADPTKVIRKKGHVQLQCRTCHNISSLLYRRMDMKALSDRKDFTPAQTQCRAMCVCKWAA